MNRIAALAVLLAATAPSAAQEPAGWSLTPGGVGPVRIGMTREEVTRLLGPLEGDQVTEGCIEAQPVRGGLPDTWFMFEEGRLTRISIGEASPLRTPRGIGVGATEAQVRRAYGSRLRTERHEYQDPPARYLTFWLRPDVRGVRFETDESRRVRTIHAGGPSIQYVEGCL